MRRVVAYKNTKTEELDLVGGASISYFCGVRQGLDMKITHRAQGGARSGMGVIFCKPKYQRVQRTSEYKIDDRLHN